MTQPIRVRSTIVSGSINPETGEEVKAGDTIPFWVLGDNGLWTTVDVPVIQNDGGDLIVEAEVSSFSTWNFDWHGECGTNFPPYPGTSEVDRVSMSSSFDQTLADLAFPSTFIRSTQRRGDGLPTSLPVYVSLLSPEMINMLNNIGRDDFVDIDSNGSVVIPGQAPPVFSARYRLEIDISVGGDDARSPFGAGAMSRARVAPLTVLDDFGNIRFTNIPPDTTITLAATLRDTRAGGTSLTSTLNINVSNCNITPTPTPTQTVTPTITPTVSVTPTATPTPATPTPTPTPSVTPVYDDSDSDSSSDSGSDGFVVQSSDESDYSSDSDTSSDSNDSGDSYVLNASASDSDSDSDGYPIYDNYLYVLHCDGNTITAYPNATDAVSVLEMVALVATNALTKPQTFLTKTDRDNYIANNPNYCTDPPPPTPKWYGAGCPDAVLSPWDNVAQLPINWGNNAYDTVLELLADVPDAVIVVYGSANVVLPDVGTDNSRCGGNDSDSDSAGGATPTPTSSGTPAPTST